MKKRGIGKEMGGDEPEERNLLFKLFLNPSVSLPCRLLDSPPQPQVIQTRNAIWLLCKMQVFVCMCANVQKLS